MAAKEQRGRVAACAPEIWTLGDLEKGGNENGACPRPGSA